MLKKIIPAFFVIFFSFFISGCYTVAWHPGEELPTNDNTAQNRTNIYNVNDFGVFSSYYNSAWWLNTENDFLIDNFNTIIEIGNYITDDDDYFYDTPIIDVIPPAKNFTRNNSNNKTTVKNIIKTKTRSNNENTKSVRNNNGNRNTSKGKGRWKRFIIKYLF